MVEFATVKNIFFYNCFEASWLSYPDVYHCPQSCFSDIYQVNNANISSDGFIQIVQGKTQDLYPDGASYCLILLKKYNGILPEPISNQISFIFSTVSYTVC